MIWMNFMLPLLLLCLWALLEEGAQACSCFPVHPQRLYCQADVVIKAKVIGVMPGSQAPSRPTKYDIKLLKTFKGAGKHFTAIYTAPNSGLCGVALTKGVQYLLMGSVHSDGLLHVHLCGFNQPWKDMSIMQKHLLYRYQEGCDCKIKSCSSFPCCMSGPTECLWTDRLSGNRDQAQNYACIKKRDGCCAWDMPAIYPQNRYPSFKGP